jgi:hypothetical protein
MMRIEKRRFTCACGHVFDAEIVSHAPLDVCVASMKAIRCPSCGNGSHKIEFGGGYSDHPPLTAPLWMRASWWMARGDVGLSSMMICSAMTAGTGVALPAGFGELQATVREYVPCDPRDFERCKKLLDLIPEWRAELGKVAERFPGFKPFFDRWEEFEALFAEESPSGACPKLYAELQATAAAAREGM